MIAGVPVRSAFRGSVVRVRPRPTVQLILPEGLVRLLGLLAPRAGASRKIQLAHAAPGHGRDHLTAPPNMRFMTGLTPTPCVWRQARTLSAFLSPSHVPPSQKRHVEASTEYYLSCLHRAGVDLTAADSAIESCSWTSLALFGASATDEPSTSSRSLS